MVHAVRRGLVVWWGAVSIGCTGGPTDAFDTGLHTTHLDTAVNDTLEGHCVTTGEKPLFVVESTVPGRVDVLHTTDYLLPDCGVYEVYMELKKVHHVILEYGRVGNYNEPCPGECLFTFTYRIAAEDGDWTFELRPGGEQRTVTVQ